jgi:hypothetical protein
MSVDFGQMERTMRSLTIGGVRRASHRAMPRELEGLREYEDQFKIGVSGRGEEFPAWTEAHLKFNIDFVDATGQRDAPFDRPHFTYGVYIEEGGPVGLIACITRWDINGRNETTGCMIAVGAVATDYARTFRGELHARFQGYGAPTEQYGDPTQHDQD